MPIHRWQPPWPPIRISEDEWIIVRDDRRKPKAIVRRLTLGEHGEAFYRIVSWAPTSAERRLFGYVRSLEEADMAVTFTREPEDIAGQLSSGRPGGWASFEATLPPHW